MKLTGRDIRILLSCACISFSGAVVSLVFPLYSKMFLKAEPIAIAWALSAGALIYIGAVPLTGKGADALGTARFGRIGTAILLASFLIMATFRSMGILVAGFLLMEVGYACFWPAVSSELSRGKSRKSLNRTLGVYNITWSTAVTVGFPVTGWIFDHNPDLPLFLGALLAATALILLWKLPQTNNGAPEPMTEIPQRPRDWRKHLISARVLLFGSFFSLGTASTFFPLLGAEIKMTALSIGMVIFFIRGVMTILFLSLVFTERWHYKFKLLLVSQAVALAGLGLFFTAGGPAFFSISLAAIGVGAGAAYGAGIYYSTFGHSDSGAKLGMHESILVCGTFAASFLGGPLAQKFNIRAPFALAALVMVGAIALAIFIMKRRQAEEA